MALILVTISYMFANHFEPAWMFEYPQNPYNAMNFFIWDAEIYGVDLEAGDEIGIFDGATCVGAILLTSPISAYPYQCVPINVSMEGGGVPGSAVNGHFIIFKLWKASTQIEYSYPEMSVWFDDDPAVQTTFLTQGTCSVKLLSYEAPTGMNAQSIAPPAGPGGGYVQNVDFPGTGFFLNEIFVNAGGAGVMTAYAFNSTPLDLQWTGTPPLHCLNYGWFVDSGSISYYASTTYPVIISFALSGLSGLENPSAVFLYRRNIHGTGPFTLVDAIYNSTTGLLTAEVTALGEFILGSNDSSNAKGILNGYVYQDGTSIPLQNVQVTLGTRTVETNSSGFYTFSPHVAGEYQVFFTASGYEPADAPVHIIANKTTSCIAYLVPATQIPSIPQNVVISRVTGGFSLSWEPSQGAQSYHIYCCLEPIGTYLLLSDTEQPGIFLSDTFLQSNGITGSRAFFQITADSD